MNTRTAPLAGLMWLQTGGWFFLEAGRLVCRRGSGWPVLTLGYGSATA